MSTSQKEINKDEMIESLKNELTTLYKTIDDKELIIIDLQTKLEKKSINGGRKSQVLEILRKNIPVSILDISNQLDISTKNVSSQLTYLRTDGYKIFTDENGKKVLFETKE